ncbi:MAG: hypothetical protein JXA14_22965 [Anaerolineae bacterium]|nr:hypothetical protein [Anaerolineae bacterium]
MRSCATDVLALVEQAQAKASAMVQEYNKLGGATFLTGFDWEGTDITEQQLLDAVSSLQLAFPDLLGGNGTNLYRVKW